jgi:putative cell wall-binding protein
LRLGGANRYETSGAINRDAFGDASVVFLAAGTDFPDALSGVALAGAFGAPLYVIPHECVPSFVLDDIRSLGASTVIALGGTASLASTVLSYTRC